MIIDHLIFCKHTTYRPDLQLVGYLIEYSAHEGQVQLSQILAVAGGMRPNWESRGLVGEYHLLPGWHGKVGVGESGDR